MAMARCDVLMSAVLHYLGTDLAQADKRGRNAFSCMLVLQRLYCSVPCLSAVQPPWEVACCMQTCAAGISLDLCHSPISTAVISLFLKQTRHYHTENRNMHSRNPSAKMTPGALRRRYADLAMRADRYNARAYVNKGNVMMERGDVEAARMM